MTKSYVSVDDPVRDDEHTVNPERREEICRAVVLLHLHTPKSTDALWGKVSAHPQRFSLAEYEETLKLLRQEEIISWTNGRWWNREIVRQKLQKLGSMKPPV